MKTEASFTDAAEPEISVQVLNRREIIVENIFIFKIALVFELAR